MDNALAIETLAELVPGLTRAALELATCWSLLVEPHTAFY